MSAVVAPKKQAAAPNQSQEVAVPDVACNLKDEGAAKVDFERQAHHFPAASDVAVRKQAAAPTEKAAPKKHRLSLAPATDVAAWKQAEALTEKATPTTHTSASVDNA